MMKTKGNMFWISISLAGVLAFSGCAGTRAASENVLLWPRMRADAFGRYLEKTFGHRDARFNSSLTNYTNSGDPVSNTGAWYEGPAFPQGSVKKVHPLIASIDLEWEHGELRMVVIRFERKLSDSEIESTFKLPAGRDYPREYGNIMSITVQDSGAKANSLVIQGFEHMGSSDCE